MHARRDACMWPPVTPPACLPPPPSRRYTVGQGRLTFDENDPKMSSTQFVKLCQDLGLVQPNGEGADGGGCCAEGG